MVFDAHSLTVPAAVGSAVIFIASFSHPKQWPLLMQVNDLSNFWPAKKCAMFDLNQTSAHRVERKLSCKKRKYMNCGHSNPPAPNQPTTVVYACSGCSDAGEIADRVARQLTRNGTAKMSCLAGIGGRVKSLMTTAENAERILLVDGCPLNCARKTFEFAGFHKFDHLELHKIGIRKGSTPVTDERIADGVAAAKKILSVAVDVTSNNTEYLTPQLPAVAGLSTITKP
jgi:uncharacterized metal-binding protein